METNKSCETVEKEIPGNVKELIAVGISAAVNCKPCMDYHVAEALKLGVSEKEITDAVSLAERIVKNASSFTQQYAGKIIKKDM